MRANNHVAVAARLFWGCLLTIAMLSSGGCRRPPQVAPANRKLIESLRTAVSAKNTAWLETNAKLVDQQHAGGALSDEAYQAFTAIIAQARGGDWQGAETRVIKLGKAQRVTEADLQRLERRQAAPEHKKPSPGKKSSQ